MAERAASEEAANGGEETPPNGPEGGAQPDATGNVEGEEAFNALVGKERKAAGFKVEG